jgi:hypothetical protein
MKLGLALRCLLPALAIAGLLLAPIVLPVAARAAATDPATQASMAMKGDMPCCPDEVPGPDCSKDCPLMALCMAKLIQGYPFAAVLRVTFVRLARLLPADDNRLAGVIALPPDRPPKA